MWIVRSEFYDLAGMLLFIHEQEVSEEDTLQNCLRRHAVYASKAVVNNRHIADFKIGAKKEIH